MRAVLLSFLVLPAAVWLYARYGQSILPDTANKLVVAGVLGGCALWHRHLLAAGMGRIWSVLFAALLAGGCVFSVLQQTAWTMPEWLHGFGCGLFVYAMLWAFHLCERESRLQSIALAALILSIGVLAKPAVLILCAVFGAIFFFQDRRLAGSVGKFFLLLFTPLLLCLFSLMALSALYYAGVTNLSWIAALPAKTAPIHFSSSPRDLWPLALGVAALLGRVIAHKSGRPDLVYLSLAIVLPDLRAVSWIPDQPSALDLSIMLVCGAGCLIATAPPLKVGERFFLLGGLGAAVGCCLWG